MRRIVDNTFDVLFEQVDTQIDHIILEGFWVHDLPFPRSIHSIEDVDVKLDIVLRLWDFHVSHIELLRAIDDADFLSGSNSGALLSTFSFSTDTARQPTYTMRVDTFLRSRLPSPVRSCSSVWR
jgi:hypothetical protein